MGSRAESSSASRISAIRFERLASVTNVSGQSRCCRTVLDRTFGRSSASVSSSSNAFGDRWMSRPSRVSCRVSGSRMNGRSQSSQRPSLQETWKFHRTPVGLSEGVLGILPQVQHDDDPRPLAHCHGRLCGPRSDRDRPTAGGASSHRQQPLAPAGGARALGAGHRRPVPRHGLDRRQHAAQDQRQRVSARRRGPHRRHRDERLRPGQPDHLRLRAAARRRHGRTWS